MQQQTTIYDVFTVLLLLLLPCCCFFQVGLHEQYGGVKPDVARDAHAAAIHSTVEEAMREAGIQPQQLSAVAVTNGPGLSLCLQVRFKACCCRS
jgi:tRNA A37 threonylcarbamoyltransferase TsaD